MNAAGPELDPSLDGLEPGLPLAEAARCVLDVRLRAVSKLLALCRGAALREPETVHHLRVATRRAAAALRIFEDCAPRKRIKPVRRSLRRIRRAAADARRCDVHQALLEQHAETAPPRLATLLRALARQAREERIRGTKGLRAAARKDGVRRLVRDRKRLLAALRQPDGPGTGTSAETAAVLPASATTLRRMAGARLPQLVKRLRTAAEADPRKVENLHSTRIAGKRLRYSMEMFSSCLNPRTRAGLYATIKELQDRLGQINDAHELVERLDAAMQRLREPDAERRCRAEFDVPLERARAGLAELTRRFRRELQRRTREFLAWRGSNSAESLLRDLARAAEPDERPVIVEAQATVPYHAPARRVAAIDAGTNSIRLVVAEAEHDGKYRIIDDQKETTRLGRGLYDSGRLTPDAMKRAVRAIARMREIAAGYHVQVLRAVATSAAREALNGNEFGELVRRRTGVELEIISAESEARLAYSSVANVFDIRGLDIAVVDIGGGSTEVVLSSSGVIEELYTLPLGGVRLAELFGGATDAPATYAALRASVERTVQRVREPSRPPDVMFGTGGTFTALAKVSLRQGGQAGRAGRFPFDVRGYELTHSEVAAILERLRAMPLRERQRVPGLSGARAEIVVQGITIVDCLMTRLRVQRLCIHDGGIRDGLLAQLVEDYSLLDDGRQADADRLAEAQRLAEACNYDRHHAVQVARLALRLYDQLAALQGERGAAWARAESRELLHVAALLHDIGCVVAYEKHHKHSYDLIVEADLSGFGRRERELLGNVARYHRGALPKSRHAAFARLAGRDQELVLHLAAILRLVDGLDRTHAQEVRGVTLRVQDGEARFAIDADVEPTVNLAAATRKSDLFERVFKLKPVLSWQPTIARPARPPGAEQARAAWQAAETAGRFEPT